MKTKTPLQMAREKYPYSFTDVCENYRQYPRRAVAHFVGQPDYRHNSERRWREMPSVVVPFCVIGQSPNELEVIRWGHKPGTVLFMHPDPEHIQSVLTGFVKRAWDTPRVQDWAKKLLAQISLEMAVAA